MTDGLSMAPGRARRWRKLLRFLAWGSAAMVVAVVASWFVPGVATGSALVASVDRAYGSTFTGCTSEVDGRRTCTVTGDKGSASDHVEVERRGRCWKARRVFVGGSRPPAPARSEGCILLRDNIRLLERALFLGPPVGDLPGLQRDS